MHLQRGQWQFRIADADNPTGYYYWTNQFYWDLDNPPDVNLSYYWVSVFFGDVMSDVTEMNWIRVYDPPEGPTTVLNANAGDQLGNYSIETGYSPFDTLLMHWIAGGKRVGYSRLRLPVQSSDQQGGLIDTDLTGFVHTIAHQYLLNAKVCDKRGVPIEDFEIDPQVRMWQYRHGTKRRERIILS